jgi:hypothetical protein
MTPLECLLRTSLVRVELTKLARDVDPCTAKILLYAANVLALVRLVAPATVALKRLGL